MPDQKNGKLQSFLASTSTLLVDFALGPSISEIVTGAVANVVYDFLKGALTKEEQEDIRKRAYQASEYLAQAGAILTDLQNELNERNKELTNLLSNIEERRTEAKHWQLIASTSEEAASALTREIERRVGEQIRTELERNKTRRQILGVIVWLFTLLAGAVIGVLAQQWWLDNSFADWVNF